MTEQNEIAKKQKKKKKKKTKEKRILVYNSQYSDLCNTETASLGLAVAALVDDLHISPAGGKFFLQAYKEDDHVQRDMQL